MLKPCIFLRKTRSYPVEVLLNNRLDKEVESIFYPFHVILTLLCASKYCIRDHFITPNEYKFYTVNFISLSYVVASFAYQMYNNQLVHIHRSDNNIVVSFLSVFLPISRCICHILYFVLNIMHCQNNVFIIVLINIIYKSLNSFQKVRCHIINSWILLALILLIHAWLTITYIVIYEIYFDVIHHVSEVLLYIFDIDFVYNVRVLLMLTNYLNSWIENIKLFDDGQEYDKIHYIKMFQTYLNILRAYDVYKTVSQVLVRWQKSFTQIKCMSNLCFILGLPPSLTKCS
ncbi:hypothetical protein B5X24_HaOG200701 [Helicoverpa armigera]|uniref:Gustatory receptor n=1 Tax=Helicoverpa armigera TaxID=29058 RepID=A0A2W1BPT2_HELAM|nr:hypothetical protein B5X24_HaOG200701 [Helicoverpa armigera]